MRKGKGRFCRSSFQNGFGPASCWRSGLSKPFVWNSKMRLTPNRCKEIAETDANRIRSLPSQSSSWAATSCGDHGQVSKSHGDWWRRWKVADLGPGTGFVFSGSVSGWSPCHQRSILKHTEVSIKAQLLVQRKRVQILHTRVINLQHLTATLYTIIAYFLSDPACPGFIRFSWQIMADYMHEFIWILSIWGGAQNVSLQL